MGSVNKFNLCQYGCNIYLETGTGTGSCLKSAVNCNCFDAYYSVDIETSFVDNAKKKYPFAFFEIGPSVDAIDKWLRSIPQDNKILFFLDAHFPGADFKGANYDIDAPNSVPLEEELKIIKKYRPDSKDYIICDDARIYQMDRYQNGNVPWLQVPGGMQFVYDIFPDRKISVDLSDEGYILIDNR